MENGKTCVGAHPTFCATASQMAKACSRPAAPVPALALPVLITKARTPSSSNRCCLQICTGAAQKRFWVKTAPTVLWGANTIKVKSSWLGFLTPACPIYTWAPSMLKISSALFTLKFTAIFDSFSKWVGEKLRIIIIPTKSPDGQNCY